jgi:hypothetical protein
MFYFHFCLSASKNRSLFQLLPASLVTDLLQLVLSLPLFLLPWGFHSRAAFGTSPSPFFKVWPIHLNFLFLISKLISSWPVTLHKSLLEIIFGHHTLRIYLRLSPLLFLLVLDGVLCRAVDGKDHSNFKMSGTASPMLQHNILGDLICSNTTIRT